jgi:hypothetical protein
MASSGDIYGLSQTRTSLLSPEACAVLSVSLPTPEASSLPRFQFGLSAYMADRSKEALRRRLILGLRWEPGEAEAFWGELCWKRAWLLA